MGWAAIMYRRRKLAERAGADSELEFYGEPQRWLPRPCFCEWNCLQRKLLGRPDPAYSFACACAGPVGIDVPGYPNDDTRMRQFCKERSLQAVEQALAPIVDWYRATCDLYMTTETGIDMDQIRTNLVQRLGQLDPMIAERLIAELA